MAVRSRSGSAAEPPPEVVLACPQSRPDNAIEAFALAYDLPDQIIHAGMAFLAAWLDRAGVACLVLDGVFYHLSDEEITSRILEAGPVCVGFALDVFNATAAAGIMRRLREEGYEGHITAGGQFATVYAEDLLRLIPDLDTVVIGEGERPLMEILRALRAGEDPRRASSLLWRDGPTLRRNPADLTPLAMEELPWMRRYDLEEGSPRRALGQVVELGRGCYASCTFCVSNLFAAQFGAAKVRRRPLDAVFDEIEHLRRQHGVEVFHLLCDEFFPTADFEQSQDFLRAFLNQIRRRRLDISFSIAARPDDVHERWFAALRAHGLSHVFLGVESIDGEELRLYGKGCTPERIREAHGILDALSIHHELGYIFYQPFSSLANLRKHVAFLAELGHRHFPYQLYPMKVHPTTPLRRRVERAGLLKPVHAVSELYRAWRFQDPRIGELYEDVRAFFESVAGPAMDVYRRAGRWQLVYPLREIIDRAIYAYAAQIFEHPEIIAEPERAEPLRRALRDAFMADLEIAQRDPARTDAPAQSLEMAPA